MFDLDDTLYKEIDFCIRLIGDCSMGRVEVFFKDIYSFMLRAYENKSDVFHY